MGLGTVRDMKVIQFGLMIQFDIAFEGMEIVKNAL